jgi:hypothetical protein
MTCLATPNEGCSTSTIFTFWGDGQMDFKDIVITCLSKDSAFSTMIQHAWGTAGGTPFEYGLQTDRDCEEARWEVEMDP